MGKRSAVVELFLGDMGSMQRELRPSTQREDQLTMETKLEQIAVKAVNQLPKSVVREIRTPRSVAAGGGQPPPATRWARRNPRPYRDHGRLARSTAAFTPILRCRAAESRDRLPARSRGVFWRNRLILSAGWPRFLRQTSRDTAALWGPTRSKPSRP